MHPRGVLRKINKEVTTIKKKDYYYWNNKENQRKLFDSLAKEFQLKEHKDWGKKNLYKEIVKKAGTVLCHHHNSSLFNALKSIYPEVEWKVEWFPAVPHRYWHRIENQKKFVDGIKDQFGIKEPSDWRNITGKDIKLNGGGTLIDHFGGSLLKMLMGIYPEVDWKKELLTYISSPRSHWKSMSNQVEYFDRMADEFGIKTHKDWGKVSAKHIINRGGNGVLNYYKGSLFRALKTVYPNIEWRREWFSGVSHFPRNYWKNLSNQREYFDKILREYTSISSDWNELYSYFIRDRGGKQLLRHYDSLQKASKILHPNKEISIPQSKTRFTTISKAHKLALEYLSNWFPKETEILSNYKHPEVIHNRSINYLAELDIFIPLYNLAFELQGIQHYQDSIFTKSLLLQKQRDREKRDQCKQLGITLVEIPYWWDLSKASLLNYIRISNPNLIDHLKETLVLEDEEIVK